MKKYQKIFKEYMKKRKKNGKKKMKKNKKRKEQILDNIEQKENSNKNEKDIDSDDTSVNISRMSGIHLEEVKSENLKPIIPKEVRQKIFVKDDKEQKD